MIGELPENFNEIVNQYIKREKERKKKMIAHKKATERIKKELRLYHKDNKDYETPDEKRNQCVKKYNLTIKGRYSRNRRSAKRRNLIFNLTFKDFESIIMQPCTYCGKPSIEGVQLNGIDRVDSSKGYIKSNCSSCCTMCNRMKLDHVLEDFKRQLHRMSFFNDYKPNWIRNKEV